MTVETQDVAKQYPGDGVTTDFGFDVPFIEDNDLTVTLFDTATGAVIVPAPVLGGLATYDYTLILPVAAPAAGLLFQPYQEGAIVRFNTAPPATMTVSLLRKTDVKQPIKLVDDAKLPASTINLEFDRLTMILQEQEAQISYIFGAIPLNDPTALIGYIMKWRGNWQANTAYGLGDVVFVGGASLYVCVVIHTSASSFDSTKWTLLVDVAAINQAVDDAQAAAAAAALAAAKIPNPSAGGVGFAPVVNAAGTAYQLKDVIVPLPADANKWDARGRILTNVLAGVGINDAVNLKQMNDALAAAGNVPPPAAPDVQKVLTATAVGVFGWQAFVVAQISDALAFMKAFLTSANAAAARAAIGAADAAHAVPASVAGDAGKWLKTTGADVFAWAAIVVANLSDATAYMKGLLTTINDAAGFRAAINAADAALTAFTNTVNLFTAAQRVTPVTTNASGAGVLSMAAGNYFVITLDANFLVQNPTNQVAGQGGLFVFVQDAAGNRVVTWGAHFKQPGGVAPTITVTANAVDVVPYYVKANGQILLGVVTQDIK